MIGDHHFFSFRTRLFGVIFLTLASGCASVPSVNNSSLPSVPDADEAPVVPIMRVAYALPINNTAISSAILSTLQRYGAAVVSVSPETGLVETDWRMATEADEKFSNTVPGVPRNNQVYEERIKLVFSVDGESNLNYVFVFLCRFTAPHVVGSLPVGSTALLS